MKYTSRKFIVALLLIAATTWLASERIMEGFDITVVFSLVGAGYGFVNYQEKKGNQDA